jgi:hypothetical protein
MNNQHNSPENSTWENLPDDHAFDFWKHYAGIGGMDKDRMVTISTWLLAFSATIIGYTIIHLDKPSSILLLILGFLICVFTCGIVLLYGSYAMWNWAMADRIAEIQNWKFLLPNRSFPINESIDLPRFKKLEFLLIKKLGRSPFPRTRYALIFRIFLLLSIFAAAINLSILVYKTI